MARKTERVVIGEDTYILKQLGANEGSDLWDDILAAIGPKLTPQLEKLGETLGTLKGMDLEGEQAKAKLLMVFAPVLVDVLSSVPKSLKQKWRKLFLANTVLCTGSVELPMGESQHFDDHFAGRYGAMTAWELACLKQNFLTFLPSKPKSANSEAGG